MEELELADMGRTDAGEDVEANALRRYDREVVDLFVPDCVAADHGHPCILLPGLYAVTLDSLPYVEPLHCHGLVEGDGVGQANFERRGR